LGPIQNACSVKGMGDGVSRFVRLSSFPKTSIVCKYWLITIYYNYINQRFWHNIRPNKDLHSLRNIRCSVAHWPDILYPSLFVKVNTDSLSLLNMDELIV
jgi:hypothetical protein